MGKSRFVKVKDPKATDIVIPILGVTGAGKSTFINIAVGADVAPVGHKLGSCTKQVVSFAVPYPGDSSRRVVFVDTPGFDGTWKGNMEILSSIADWLEHSYRTKNKLAGIIFLHEITQARILSPKIFDMLEKLCGCDAAKNVTIVTTKWDNVEEAVGMQREQELFEDFLNLMLQSGSSIERFRDTPESVWGIVDSLVEQGPVDAVQIQKDLVDLKKRLAETEAGIALGNNVNASPLHWNTFISLLGRLFSLR